MTRRIEEAPKRPDDLRAWLFGIARNCLLDARRGQGRSEALAVRLAEATSANGAADGFDPELVALRIDLAAAWRELSVSEQEVLALAVFENLTSSRAGHVLGITSVAYRLRLVRARRILRRRLDRAHAGPVYPISMESGTWRSRSTRWRRSTRRISDVRGGAIEFITRQKRTATFRLPRIV